MKHTYMFYIDVVGACNLRCPSCPVGNTPEVKNAQGFMSPETLMQIIEKATKECAVSAVGLYNWTEPLLHPRLPEMIRVVRKYGLNCYLSSNLNRGGDLEEILAEKPFSLRITLSGFDQVTYGKTHKGGDIERVKENMRRLSDLKKKTKAGTAIEVAYQRSLSNVKDELPMKRFSEQLGLKFKPLWALFLPLEKVFAKIGIKDYGIINDADQAVIDNLALPLENALEAARILSERRCDLQENVIALDVMGRAQLCCGVYDGTRFSVADYLTTHIDDIQALRLSHSTCKHCVMHGVNTYFTYRTPNMDMLAERNIAMH